MKKKILLVVVLVVLLLGAGVAYAYFETDFFKTEKEIFLSYLLDDKMTADEEKMAQYFEKKESTSHTYSGEVGMTVNGMENEGIDMLNGSNITFEGATNPSQKLTELELTANLATGVNVPIMYKQDGETYGIQTNLLDKRYIAVRNENLKELAEMFGLDSTTVPDKIELENTTFTDEELKTLKERYVGILEENLPEELFSKEKVNKQTIVTLSMGEDKFVEVFTKILETLRNDEIILNKLPVGYDVETFQSSIDEMLSDIDGIADPENKVEIKLYIDNKAVDMIEAKYYEGDKNIANLVISSEVTENDLVVDVTMRVQDDDQTAEISAKMQYKNILTLDNVEESMQVKMLSEGTTEDIDLSIDFTNTVKFEEREIENFNDTNSIILNDATEEDMMNLLTAIYSNLGLI